MHCLTFLYTLVYACVFISYLLPKTTLEVNQIVTGERVRDWGAGQTLRCKEQCHLQGHTADGGKPYDKNNRRLHGKYITTTSRQLMRLRNREESRGRGIIQGHQLWDINGALRFGFMCQRSPKSKGGFPLSLGLPTEGGWGRKVRARGSGHCWFSCVDGNPGAGVGTVPSLGRTSLPAGEGRWKPKSPTLLVSLEPWWWWRWQCQESASPWNNEIHGAEGAHSTWLNVHDYVEKENCNFGGELYGICD